MSLYASGIVRIITDPALRSFDSGTMVANFAGGIMEGLSSCHAPAALAMRWPSDERYLD
jgi:hypothetical protein